jgi:Tfp pilus assembly protein PilO
MLQREPDQYLRTLTQGLNIAGALVTASLVMAGGWLVLGSLTGDTAQTAARLEALHALLGDEGRLRAEHAKFRQQLDKAKQDEAAIQKRIPSEPQEAVFLAQVSQAADTVELQIKDYRPGVISPGKTWSTLRVELTCEGSYLGICTFLDSLQDLPRYSTVARLEIDPGTTAEHYLAKLCLELYFFNDGHKLAAR